MNLNDANVEDFLPRNCWWKVLVLCLVETILKVEIRISWKFSCKSFSKLLDDFSGYPAFDPFNQIWKLKILSMVKILAWAVSIPSRRLVSDPCKEC